MNGTHNKRTDSDDNTVPAIWDVPERFRAIYAHSVEVPSSQRLLYVSGQVGMQPDGTLAEGFEAQCVQAMTNVETLLRQAGMSREHLVKMTYLLTDAGDVPTLTELRRVRWSTATPPPVTVIVVAALANPGFRIEIDATAASAPTQQG